MLPPQLQQKPGQIVFQLFRAEALKKMDTFYSIDPYVVLECKSNRPAGRLAITACFKAADTHRRQSLS